MRVVGTRNGFLVAMAALTLTACGGGSSAPAPTPTPAPTPNAPPVFTSGGTATVAENTTAAYTATATDANGDPLAFSLSGGADAALFQISAAGALTFRAPPDFEVPRDADRNNSYLVEITVSDGKANVALPVAITVTDVTGGTYAIRRVTAVGPNPTNLVAAPGSTRLFVTEKGGRVMLLNMPTGALIAQPFLDVSAQLSTDGERGLLGFAPAPDFAQSGTVYLAMTNFAGELEVRRYRTFAGDRDRADPATADLILKVPAASAAEFAAGWIGFGPDGLLSITTGSGRDPNSDISDLRGKVLRIDVSSDAYPADPERDYTVPATNPGGAGRDEIFARGFARPQTASIDRASGFMYVEDLGYYRLEPFGGGNRYVHGHEVNLIRLQDGGHDYSANDGRQCLGDSPLIIYCGGLPLNPVFGPAPELTVGPVYRGPVEALQARLFVSSPLSTTARTIFNIDGITTAQAVTISLAPVTGVNAMGEDSLGNLYFLQPDGQIYVLEPA
jgi:hypothetical protein